MTRCKIFPKKLEERKLVYLYTYTFILIRCNLHDGNYFLFYFFILQNLIFVTRCGQVHSLYQHVSLPYCLYKNRSRHVRNHLRNHIALTTYTLHRIGFFGLPWVEVANALSLVLSFFCLSLFYQLPLHEPPLLRALRYRAESLRSAILSLRERGGQIHFFW